MANELTVINSDLAVSTLDERKNLLLSIVTPDDIQMIQGKQFKKKSYWRKLAIVYGLSLQKMEERCEGEEGSITYHFTYRSINQGGQFVDGTGSCTQNEKGKRRSIHDTRATAETRAKNRAISDMLAWGEVSAEEVEDDHGQPEAQFNRQIEQSSHQQQKNDPQSAERALIEKELKKLIEDNLITYGDMSSSIRANFPPKQKYSELNLEEAKHILAKMKRFIEIKQEGDKHE